MNEQQRKDYVHKMYNLSVNGIYAGNSEQTNLYTTKRNWLSGANSRLELLLAHN